MPHHTIHLAQSATARGWVKAIGTSAKDAQIINGLVEVSTNQLLGTKTVYVTKRSGSAANGDSPSAEVVTLKHYSSRFGKLYVDDSFNLYEDDTDLGALSAGINTVSNYQVCDTVISNVGVIGFVTSDNAGWILYEDAISDNFPSFTGDTTSGSDVVTNIPSTTGIYPGQLVTGTGIAADTRVESVDSSTQITLTKNATANGTGVTITKEAVSKITDANFPSDATNMEVLDNGFFLVGAAKGNIHNSDQNDPFTWPSAEVIAADYSGDNLQLIFKIGDYICSAGSNGAVEYFYYDAGNTTGSVLSAATNLNIYGITCLHRPVQHASGVYFIGQEKIDTKFTRGLYRINGVNSVEPVSDDIWNSIITDNSLSFVSPITNGNKSLLAVHSSAASTFPIYDPVTSAFTFFSLSAALTSAFRETFTISGTDGALDWAQGNTWTDLDAAYTLTIQTEPQDMAGGVSCTDKWAEILADTESTGTATLSTSEDEGANWITRGTFDMTAQKKRAYRIGFHRGPRAYRIQHSANTGFRGQVLRVNFVPSAH